MGYRVFQQPVRHDHVNSADLIQMPDTPHRRTATMGNHLYRKRTHRLAGKAWAPMSTISNSGDARIRLVIDSLERAGP